MGLIDTTAWYGPDAPAAWEKRAAKAESEGLASLIDFQLTRWFTEDFRRTDPQAARACVEVFLANDIGAYAATCRMLGQADLREGLRSLQGPVSIVVGREDYATPVAMAEDMQRGIEGASLHVIERARHLTPVEAPDAVAAELVQLCHRARAAGPNPW